MAKGSMHHGDSRHASAEGEGSTGKSEG
jgi:hypothetical protein